MRAIERIRLRTSAFASPRFAALAWAVLIAMLLLAPALVRAQGAGSDSLTLRWTAPGDDGTFGEASRYEIRMSTSEITLQNYVTAQVLPDVPPPMPASSLQAMMVRGLTRGTTYWFAMRVLDEAGNISPISNVLRWEWPRDHVAPAAPQGLAISLEDAGKAVRLHWERNAEVDLAGYVIYRASAELGPWERLNAALVHDVEFEDATMPGLADALYYTVTAADVAGNEGPRAPLVGVSVKGNLQALPNAWRLLPPYPNPSRPGQVVKIPLTVPASAGDAAIEILDGAGQLVRRFGVQGASIGIYEVQWDGRNAAGQMCAPGVYRAWLVTDGQRQLVRVARVPA